MENAKEFKNMCRAYNAVKRRACILEDRMKDPSCRTSSADQYEVLRSLTDEVDRVIEEISAKHGKRAGEMVRDLYIMRLSDREVAERYGISRRTLYRRCREYLGGCR